MRLSDTDRAGLEEVTNSGYRSYWITGATGTTGETGATGATGPNFATQGFSAFLATLSTTTSAQLTNWTTTSPFYGNANFNATTGNYTVPVTGRY